MWCHQCWVVKPALFCRRWRRGRSEQKLEEMQRRMETWVSLLPLFPFINREVYRKPSPTLFPSSGMLSSSHQAPPPVLSHPHPCEFLRSGPCLTITGRSQLRIVAWLKTYTNEPHQLKVLPVRRPLVPDLHLSSNSDLLSYHMAFRAVPISHLIAWDHGGPHWKIQKRVQVDGIKTSNQERNAGDTASMTTTCWKRPSPWWWQVAWVCPRPRGFMGCPIAHWNIKSKSVLEHWRTHPRRNLPTIVHPIPTRLVLVPWPVLLTQGLFPQLLMQRASRPQNASRTPQHLNSSLTR